MKAGKVGGVDLMIEIPAFIFDKIWRSQRATKKYVEDVLKKKVDFLGKSVLD